MLVLPISLLLGATFAVPCGLDPEQRFPCRAPDCKPDKTTYLYVWAGAATSAANDTVFTFDITCGSASFGQLLSESQIPYHGTEPHHCGVNTDGTVLGVGGLLAVLSALPDVYFFSLEDPTKPTYWKSEDPPQSAVADEFVPTPDGGFFVTMMGANNGGDIGRVARFDRDMNVIGEFPSSNLPASKFMPHGIAVDWKRKLMVTTDYIIPATTLVGNGPPVFGTTFRLWNVTTMQILATYDLAVLFPGSYSTGIMDARLLGDTGVVAICSGDGTNLTVFAYDLATRGITLAYSYPTPQGNAIMASFRNGERLAVANFVGSQFFLLDTSKAEFTTRQIIPMPAGVHLVRVTDDERTLVTVSYFLDEGSAGVVHMPGNQHMYIFDVAADGNSLQPAAVPEFDFSAVGVGFRPHGIAFHVVSNKKANTDGAGNTIIGPVVGVSGVILVAALVFRRGKRKVRPTVTARDMAPTSVTIAL